MMFERITFLSIVCAVLTCLIECGAGEVLTPGEEVEVKEWMEPVDIGKTYSVGDVKRGDTVLLETGKEHVMGQFDIIGEDSDGREILIYLDLEEERDGVLLTVEVPKGIVVPKGPPVVRIVHYYETDERGVITAPGFGTTIACRLRVDRTLPYHLVVYIETQSMDKEESGGKVIRQRKLFVVPKGERESAGIVMKEAGFDRERVSICILPHTEMEKINLPAEIDPANKMRFPEDKVLLEEHKFRPYRIASPSCLIRESQRARNW